ncbi:TPA: hypothetical protein ACF3XE_006901, partial [Pseudomonas aeruginosa]
ILDKKLTTSSLCPSTASMLSLFSSIFFLSNRFDKFNGVHAYMTDNGFQAAAVAWFKGQL